jgi:hypothetical protein
MKQTHVTIFSAAVNVLPREPPAFDPSIRYQRAYAFIASMIDALISAGPDAATEPTRPSCNTPCSR